MKALHAGTVIAAAVALLATAACGASDDGAMPGGYLPGTGGLVLGTGGSTSEPNFPPLGGGPSIPEEFEAVNYTAPVATGKYLWTANPLSGRVALIDIETRGVDVFPAGLAPTYLAPVKTADDSPSALVVNVGSANVSWFRRVKGKIVETKIRTQLRVNRSSVSSSGRYALFWAEAEPGDGLDVSDGLQDLTLADLSVSPPKVTRLTVGYRPRDVRLAPDEKRAVVVGESDITLLELGEKPEASGYVPLGTGNGRDVSFDVDLRVALVRRSQEKIVEVLDLDDPAKNSAIDFEAVVTDLDLTEGGLGVAVLRETSSVAVFDLNEILADPAAFELEKIAGETFGSAVIAPDEKRALLYTTSGDSSRVVVLELEDGPNHLKSRAFDSTAPTHDIRVSPDGKHALVVSGTPSLGLGKVFSVISLDAPRFPRVVSALGPIQNAVISSEAVLVTATGADASESLLVGLPSLGLERVELASKPSSAGFLEGERAFVAQEHSEGRLTFYGLERFDEGYVETSTLTGFELAADVVTR